MKELSKKINNLSLKNISVSILFYIAYFFIIMSDIFNSISAFENVLNIIDVISVGILMVVIISNKKVGKNEILLWLFLIIVAISALKSNDRSLLKLPFLLLAFKNINFNKFIKLDMFFRLILITVLMLFNIAGITDNGILEVRDGFVRNSFGLGHPNSFAFYIVMICLDYFYINSIKKENSIIKPLLLVIIAIAFIFFFVGSRTNIIILILIYIVFLLKNKIKFGEKNIIIYSFGICMLGSILCAYLYDPNNSFFVSLDNILSRRLYLANYFVNKYPLTLFGNKVVTGGFYALDNAYVNLFVRYGIVLSVYFIVMFRNTFKTLIKNKQYTLVLVLTIFSIYGISETPMYIPAKNPYILLLALSWVNNTKKIKEGKNKNNE